MEGLRLLWFTKASGYAHEHECCPQLSDCSTSLVSHDSIACLGKNELSEQEKKSLELPAQ